VESVYLVYKVTHTQYFYQITFYTQNSPGLVTKYWYMF